MTPRRFISVDARVRRTDGMSFNDAVRAACRFHEGCFGTKATHIRINQKEPGAAFARVPVSIISDDRVQLGEFEAYRDTGS